MESSLAASTRASQRSAVRSWVRFCDVMHIDMLCRGVRSVAVMENIVAQYLSFEIGVRGMSPHSMKNVYLGGISNHFVELNVRNQFDRAMATKFIKYVLRGYTRIYSKMHPESGMKKVAFTIELTTHTMAAMEHAGLFKSDLIKREAIMFALVLGIYFLLRKSEYLSTSKDNKGRKWKHVRFMDRGGKVIPWAFVGRTQAVEMVLNVDTSKTDQFGRGRLVRHKVVEGPNCIVKKTVDWLVKCRDEFGAGEEDYIFQIGTRVLVRANDMAAAMKCTMDFLGLDGSKVTAHSLRYGGATMLAAAGLPHYVIAYFGGWTADSKSLLAYMQLGAEAIANASGIMASGFRKSLTETRSRIASLFM